MCHSVLDNVLVQITMLQSSLGEDGDEFEKIDNIGNSDIFSIGCGKFVLDLINRLPKGQRNSILKPWYEKNIKKNLK